MCSAGRDLHVTLPSAFHAPLHCGRPSAGGARFSRTLPSAIPSEAGDVSRKPPARSGFFQQACFKIFMDSSYYCCRLSEIVETQAAFAELRIIQNKINVRKCFTCQKSLTSSLLTYEKENTRMYLAEKTDILPLGKDAENPPKKSR